MLHKVFLWVLRAAFDLICLNNISCLPIKVMIIIIIIMRTTSPSIDIRFNFLDAFNNKPLAPTWGLEAQSSPKDMPGVPKITVVISGRLLIHVYLVITSRDSTRPLLIQYNTIHT